MIFSGGVVLPDKYYGELQGLHRQLNFSIAGKASLDQLQAVLDSLEEAMNKGKTFRDWQKDVRVQDLGLPKHRLDNIFRTNIQAAYNRGHWEKFVEHQKTRPYLMYDAINDSRVRPSHLAMDGIIRPVGDPFWAAHYPPNGYRCRCRCISLSERQAQDRSKNGTGLNKQVTQEMNPDKGWDYNVGQDLTAGIDKAIDDALASPKVNPKLKKSLITWLSDKVKAFFSKQNAPVSNALILPKSGFVKEVAEVVLVEIDKVHGDGILPKIPIVAMPENAKKNRLGYYRRNAESGKAIEIGLSKNSNRKELTLAHEIGHFISHQAIGVPKRYDFDNELFVPWLDAVLKSDSIRYLNENKDYLTSLGINVDYYLLHHEIWARCYAQYVAVKSGNEKLQSQLDGMRSGLKWNSKRQWQDTDFEPIMNAIDELFTKLGWLS
jgi:SPP1 gp7 family putative phage head morphogenesis protein